VTLVFLDLPLRELARGENLPVSEGTEPTPVALFGARDLAHLHEVYGERRAVLREVAARRGVPVVDVEAAFARHQAEQPGEEMFGSYDLVHPTTAGARVIAAALVEKLRELSVYR
jgi:lysophospholipase L1-like esterase